MKLAGVLLLALFGVSLGQESTTYEPATTGYPTTDEPQTSAEPTFDTSVAPTATSAEPTYETTLAPQTTEEPYCWEEAKIEKFNHIIQRNRETDSIQCTICTFIFQGLDDILIENEESIADALTELCSSIPIETISEICFDLLSKCTDDIIEAIIEYGLNADDICGGLGLCP